MAEGTTPRRSSLGQFVAEGALVVVLSHTVGPLAVMLAPAGVVLIRITRPLSDVLEDAVRRCLST